MAFITLNPEETIRKNFPNVAFNFDKKLCRKVIDYVIGDEYKRNAGCFGGFFTKYASGTNYVAHYFETEYNECVEQFGMDLYVVAKLNKSFDHLDESDWHLIVHEKVHERIKVSSNLYIAEITVPRVELRIPGFEFRIVVHLVAGEMARKDLIEFDYFPTQIFYDYSADEILVPLELLKASSRRELHAILPNNGMTDQENRKRVLRIKKMIFKGFHFNKDVLKLVLNYK